MWTVDVAYIATGKNRSYGVDMNNVSDVSMMITIIICLLASKYSQQVTYNNITFLDIS